MLYGIISIFTALCCILGVALLNISCIEKALADDHERKRATMEILCRLRHKTYQQ